jgi:putative ubiquitin-RnfH superfamily antitoxin RatB of RatAB toxin-antitoxin module
VNAASTINVEVVYAEPDRQLIISVNVDAGTTVGGAIVQSGVMMEFPELDVESSKVGIFGKATAMETKLQEGDRVEIYRPLIADPKEVRRKKAASSASNKASKK